MTLWYVIHASAISLLLLVAILTKAAKPNPFTFLDRITWSKDETWGEFEEENYVAFLINRHFSLFPDTVLYANDINIHHSTASKEMQFRFLINSLPKRKRFSKWKKKTVNPDIGILSRYMGINEHKAEELLPLVSESDMEMMRQHNEHTTKRGSGNVRRSKAK